MMTSTNYLCFLILVSSVATIFGACPTSWIENGYDCYHLSMDQKSWSEAMDMCGRLGGGLVEIDTAEEQAFLQTHTSTLNRLYWIGLSITPPSSVDWTWVYTNTTLSVDMYSNWRPDNPNNSTGYDECTLMFPGGQWDDIMCSFNSYYICEWDKIGNANNVIG